MRHSPLPEGVISVDIANDGNRLHLLTGKHRQGQKTLWYQVSNDDGKSWSTAVKILDADSIPANIVRGNDAQITAQGDTILVTWMSYVEGARFNAGPMMAVRSIDGGKTWQNVPSPPDWKKGPHGYIDMTSDSNAMHVVWLDSRSGSSGVSAAQALHYSRSVDGGTSWQKNQTLDGLTCSCCWNTIKSDVDGNVYVLFRDKQPSDMSIGVIDRQQHWQRLNHVGAFNWQFEGCPHIGGGLDFQRTEGKQLIHAVVGSGQEDHLGVYYLYSTDAGKNWSAPRPMGDESSVHGDIAAHDNGRVVAVWDMMGADGLTVFAAESSDSGKENWTGPLQLSRSGVRASHPRIIKTNKGFLAVWTEHDGQLQKLAMRRL
ncbi:MAG: hypothetical protein ACU85E_11360 [Gammaproteobacteria bacterium]